MPLTQAAEMSKGYTLPIIDLAEDHQRQTVVA